MRMIMHLAARNIRVYLRDRTAVFFSLLSVFIIIGLYAVFLGATNVRSIENMAKGANASDVRWLVDSWIMAGILVVNSITVSLGLFGIMIDDEAKKRIHAYLVAPVSRGRLVAGYLVASNAVGLLLSGVAFVLVELYIVVSGGHLLSLDQMVKVIGLLIINVISSSSIVFFLVSFIRSASAFSTLSTILGTIIGFITGIYVPVGVLPEFLQTIIKFVPATHSAAMLRQIFMAEPLKLVFANAPAGVQTEYTRIYGVDVIVSGKPLSMLVMLGIVIGTGLIFLVFSILRMRQRKIG
jgi:multidrug/hemolysin transport system permease protein